MCVGIGYVMSGSHSKEGELGYVHSQYYVYGVGWVSGVCHSNSIIVCVHSCVVCLSELCGGVVL